MIDADPYPWPFDGVLDPSRLALVIAGAQAGWIDRSVGCGSVADVVERLTSVFRARGSLVVALRHTAATARHHRVGLPPARGAAGWDLSPAVEADLVVDCGLNGFHNSALDEELLGRSIDHLVFCGYGAEATVDSTVRSANDRGYECLTLTDAVAPFDAAVGARALASVTMSGGIFGAIAPSDALLTALSSLEPLEVS